MSDDVVPQHDPARQVLENEDLVYGPSVRRALWICALRGIPYEELEGLYHSIMDEEMFKTRIYTKIQTFKRLLRRKPDTIVREKKNDEFGVRAIEVVYYPADRYLHSQELQIMNIDRDAPASQDDVRGFVDDLLKQGVPPEDICAAFEADGCRIYANLFARWRPEDELPEDIKCPAEILDYIRENGSKVEFELLACSLPRLIEHAPTLAVKTKLLTVQRRHKIQPQKGRSLAAKQRWYKTWDRVLAATSGRVKADLEKIDSLVEPTRPAALPEPAYRDEDSD